MVVSFLSFMVENLQDARHLGPGVLRRHLVRRAITKVGVPGVGNVVIRAGDSDMAVVRQVFVWREYDLATDDPTGRRIRERYRAILNAGGKPIIVDAGANIGAASLRFAADFPDARLVAVEPDPENAAVLRQNLAGRPNCVVLEAAIGAERGFVALHNQGQSWAVRTERASAGVPIVTVEDAFEASGGHTPFIVKIDIEGFEKDLFATNTAWIDRCFVVAIEPHDWMLPGEGTSRPFQQLMGSKPFEIHVRGENLVYLRADAPGGPEDSVKNG